MPKLTLYFDPTFGDKSWAGSYFSIDAPEPEESHHTRLGEWIVGRHPQCDLTIGIPSVSRKHAAIAYSFASDRWTITDLGSTSGTRLDGQLLQAHDPNPICIGSRLNLGNALIRIVEDEMDTINTDDGPTTVAGLNPLDHHTGEPLPPPPSPPPKTMADTLYLGASWIITPTTMVGMVYRLIIIAVSALVAVLILGAL